MALKGWKTLCMSKDSGGLGFKSFQDINMALLTKLGWMMAKGMTGCGWIIYGISIYMGILVLGANEKRVTL